MINEVMRYRAERVVNLLIIKKGRTFLHAVVLDGNVRITKLPLAEQRGMEPLMRRGEPYPCHRAARKFLAAGRTLGITKNAKAVLRGLTSKGAE